MTVLAVHNYYQQPGGEDQVFAAEADLLEAHGHRVLRYTAHNDRLVGENPLALAKTAVWNGEVYRDLCALIKREQPRVVHFHNTFPLVSPAAYYAARAEGAPVVQSLHNYRLMCPNSLFFRDGGICEDCLGKPIPWPGVAHACYRESRAASGVVAMMLTVHRALRTWKEMVDAYVTLTGFAREKFIQGGLPKEKISVKPNFINSDPGAGEGSGGYALFVGRLSVEKGLGTLLAAWERLGERIPLKIVGDGPLADRVVEAAGRLPQVEWLGRRSAEEVYALMGEASALVFPSECYEGFPRVIVEAFAKGTPIIVANVGSTVELVDHRRTGLHFRSGDPNDLVVQVEWALRHPVELARMRREARAEFETRYTAERNYQALMEIYESAMARAEARV